MHNVMFGVDPQCLTLIDEAPRKVIYHTGEGAALLSLGSASRRVNPIIMDLKVCFRVADPHSRPRFLTDPCSLTYLGIIWKAIH